MGKIYAGNQSPGTNAFGVFIKLTNMIRTLQSKMMKGGEKIKSLAYKTTYFRRANMNLFLQSSAILIKSIFNQVRLIQAF